MFAGLPEGSEHTRRKCQCYIQTTECLGHNKEERNKKQNICYKADLQIIKISGTMFTSICNRNKDKQAEKEVLYTSAKHPSLIFVPLLHAFNSFLSLSVDISK